MIRKLVVAALSLGLVVAGAGGSGAVAAGISVPVPVQVIYPGDAIMPGQLTMKAFRKSYILKRGPVRERAAVTGKVARRTLLPGKPIMASSLREAYLVNKGKPVRVSYVAGGLTITTLAMALSSGSAGDLVHVRNIDSGQQVAGQVTADGSVRIRGQ